jgi:hypothetical protein
VLTEAQRKQIRSVFSPPGPLPGLPGAGNAGGSQPGTILSLVQQDTLRLSTEQKKRIAEIQKDVDAKLETLLTEDQRNQLQAMRLGPTGVRIAGPGGPGRGPQGGTPLFRAYRYAIDFPGFAGKTLTPGKRLEDLQPKEPDKKLAVSKK